VKFRITVAAVQSLWLYIIKCFKIVFFMESCHVKVDEINQTKPTDNRFASNVYNPDSYPHRFLFNKISIHIPSVPLR